MRPPRPASLSYYSTFPLAYTLVLVPQHACVVLQLMAVEASNAATSKRKPGCIDGRRRRGPVALCCSNYSIVLRS